MNIIDELVKRLITRKSDRGRLLPLLLKTDRWEWWAEALDNRFLPQRPWPKLDFAAHFPDSAPAMKMFRNCMQVGRMESGIFDKFIEWILFQFGDRDIPNVKHISDESKDVWMKEFDAQILLDDPGDWLGHYYEQEASSNYTKGGLGFFSTPPNIVKMMCQMLLKEGDLLKSFNDPCIGTGRFPLEASNYCLNISGNDINITAVNITKINAWLYMPSVITGVEGIREKPPEYKVPEMPDKDDKDYIGFSTTLEVFSLMMMGEVEKMGDSKALDKLIVLLKDAGPGVWVTTNGPMLNALLRHFGFIKGDGGYRRILKMPRRAVRAMHEFKHFLLRSMEVA